MEHCPSLKPLLKKKIKNKRKRKKGRKEDLMAIFTYFISKGRKLAQKKRYTSPLASLQNVKLI